MRAYKIVIGLLLFQFSIPIAGAIGFAGPLSGSTSLSGLVGIALQDPTFWIGEVGLPLLGVGVANKIFGLQTNLGALIFAGAFMVSKVPLSATLTQLSKMNLMIPEIRLLLTTVLNVVFLFAFVQLASTPAKGAH